MSVCTGHRTMNLKRLIAETRDEREMIDGRFKSITGG